MDLIAVFLHSASIVTWSTQESFFAVKDPNLVEAFMSLNKSTIGYSVQAGGAGCVLVGAVLSVHHAAIAACLLAGSAALYVGKRIRTGT